MTPDLAQSLLDLERWIEQDSSDVLRFIAREEGFDPFWQLLVASLYDENPIFLRRLIAAVHHIAKIALADERKRFSERLLGKADVVCSITGEENVHAVVRRIVTILNER